MICAKCGANLGDAWIVLCGLPDCEAGVPPRRPRERRKPPAPWLSIHPVKATHPRPEEVR